MSAPSPCTPCLILYRRRWTLWCAGLSLALFLATGGSVAVHRYAQRRAEAHGDLLTYFTVYRGLGTGYERLFGQPRQPGVEFSQRDRRGTWWRIELADGEPLPSGGSSMAARRASAA